MKNVIKFWVIGGIFMLLCVNVQAQLLDKVIKAGQKSAEDATVRKVEQKTSEAVNKSIDKALEPNSNKGDNNAKEANKQSPDEAKGKDSKEAAPQGAKAAEMAYAKSDFVPGDVIIFDDDGSREKLGEFPSQWDLEQGVAEMMTVNAEKAIRLGEHSTIIPLMKNMREYLPSAYTFELDFYNYESTRRQMNDAYHFYFRDKDKYEVFRITISPGHNDKFFAVDWYWKTPDGENRSGSQEVQNSPTGRFYRMAVSFNQRALKVYFDGVRVVNIPNCAKAANFAVHGGGYGDNNKFIKNIRLAQGAVPLYDRLASDGKFITYGITFDIGKSTIKPESMGEINRIVTLMKENPELKFSVEGHTDNTGNSANNQTLSEARSQAVVDKLVEMGISKDRLKAAGKGQTAPIADNSTDEGRAKNRRVEFVKIK